MSRNRLARLKPIDSLSDHHRNQLLAKVTNEVLPYRVELDAGKEKDWFVYLLDGEIRVQTADGDGEKFDATSRRAFQPIFADATRPAKAVFQTECRIARVDRRLFHQICEEKSEEDGYDVNAAEAAEMQADVLKKLFEDYQKGTIPVPSIPEAAMRVRQLIDDPDASIMELARYVEQDPAMAGKVVAASNSALSGGQTTIGSVKDALVRLGMKPAGDLITWLSMKGLFDFPSANLRKTAKEIWRYSVLVGASARVLADEYGAGIDGDKAFLAGLLHNIGAVALLAYFDEFEPSSREFMTGGSLHEICAMVSTMVAQSWDLDGDFVTTAESTAQWGAEGCDNAYAAVVNLARQQVHAIHDPGLSVPAVEELAGFELLKPALDDGIAPVLKDNDYIESTLAALA
ncbi:MAG: HDOD domain-containing protein [Xanthomonadales bacterium]|nr:HDOD domain-containing protein [Xanthomonadales bacterium]